ncbi:hypothetical protein [Paenibacillus pinihumi]|nr:hypothetical protein [Paenibacillus pinihumi]
MKEFALAHPYITFFSFLLLLMAVTEVSGHIAQVRINKHTKKEDEN